MQALCSAVALLGLNCTSEADVQLSFDFHNHLAKYGISYGADDEYKFRFELFKENDAKINAINAKNGSYTVAHNKFSTMTKEEFQKMLGKKPVPAGLEAPVEYLDTSDNGVEVDWRKEGAVNAVQDQGQCGSCWAFSSVAAMEGEHFIKTGELLKLSEQQFVDCDPQSDGCGGGLEIWAFQYAKENGLELEKDYGYTAYTGTCEAKKKKEIVEAKKYFSVPKKSIAQLKAAVKKQPTCVSVDAETDFQFYQGGILDVSDCGTDLDHAVTAVGYGSENGKEYLIVRNSWGADWGEDGYIRIALDKDGDGVCGVLLDSNRPITN